MTVDRENVQQIPSAPESVLAALDEEQWNQRQRQAQELVSSDPYVNLLTTVLIYSPQVYQLARYALRCEMEVKGYTWDDGVEEMILQSAKAKANKPACRQDVARNVAGPVLRFLTNDLENEVRGKLKVDAVVKED